MSAIVGNGGNTRNFCFVLLRLVVYCMRHPMQLSSLPDVPWTFPTLHP